MFSIVAGVCKDFILDNSSVFNLSETVIDSLNKLLGVKTFVSAKEPVYSSLSQSSVVSTALHESKNKYYSIRQ